MRQPPLRGWESLFEPRSGGSPIATGVSRWNKNALPNKKALIRNADEGFFARRSR
jgi:hypothetical protein